jgi:hypothetical protein
MKIIEIIDSPRKGKRYRAIFDDQSHIDFGLDNPKYGTYIDHHSKERRKAYWARHYGSESERELLHWIIPSASTLSAFLLWGTTTDLKKNVEELNDIWANQDFKHY